MVSSVFNLNPNFAAWEAISEAVFAAAETVVAVAVAVGLLALLARISVRVGSQDPSAEAESVDRGKDGPARRAHSV
jgi:hypothetical protein